MSPGATRRLKLDRELDDECRALEHGSCTHIGSGGGLRTAYVVACTCRCHVECPATDADPGDMAERCTCPSTGRRRARRAAELGIKHKQLREISRGSPTSPEGRTTVSIGFLIASVVIAAIFVVSLTLALNSTGAVRGIAVVGAAVTGLYLLSTVVMIAFVELLVTILRSASKRR